MRLSGSTGARARRGEGPQGRADGPGAHLDIACLLLSFSLVARRLLRMRQGLLGMFDELPLACSELPSWGSLLALTDSSKFIASINAPHPL